jgi:hypothetical protein
LFSNSNFSQTLELGTLSTFEHFNCLRFSENRIVIALIFVDGKVAIGSFAIIAASTVVIGYVKIIKSSI